MNEEEVEELPEATNENFDDDSRRYLLAIEETGGRNLGKVNYHDADDGRVEVKVVKDEIH